MTTYSFAGQYGPEPLFSDSFRLQRGVSVAVYAHGTTTPVALYTDRTKAAGATNPVLTDVDGNLTFWTDPGAVDIAVLGTTFTVLVPLDPAESAAATGGLLASANLSDLADAATARTNLGLGSAATQPSSAFDAAGLAAAETTRALAAEALLAPLASPALTGDPTAPTQGAGDNSNKLATTSFATGVQYVAPPTGDTTGVGDAPALAQAIALGKYLQAGTYYANFVVTPVTNSFLRGLGRGITTIQAASGVTLAAVIQSQGFGTTFAEHFDISSLTVSGTSTSGNGIALDGWGFNLNNLEIKSSGNNGVVTQNTAGFQSGHHWLEAQMINVVSHDNAGKNFFLNGPTDMQLVNVVGVNPGSGNHNIHVGSASSGIQFVNSHAWGAPADWAWYLEAPGCFIDCEGEGATSGQCFLGHSNIQWIGGRVFAPASSSSVGWQVGDGTHTNVTNLRIIGQAENFSGNAIAFNNDNGHSIFEIKAVDCGFPPFTGTPSGSSRVEIFAGSLTTPDANVGSSLRLDFATFQTRVSVLGESLFVNQVRSPTVAPTVVATNPAGGATSYLYKIACRNGSVSPADASPSPASTSVINAAILDTSNFNTISWTAGGLNGAPFQVVLVSTDGGTTYRLLGVVGGNVSTYVDKVGTGSAYTPGASAVGGAATVDGNFTVTSAGTVVLNFNGSTLPHIRLNGASGSAPSVGTAVGVGRDNASGVYLAHNGGGVYALKGAAKGNVLDDGSGNASFKGTNTSSGATVTTPTFTSGTATQLADLTKDAMVYLDVTLAGTLTVAIGPTSGVANALYGSVAVTTASAFPPIRLPAGWFIKVTAVTATYTAVVVTC